MKEMGNQPMKALNHYEQIQHEKADTCHICHRHFYTDNGEVNGEVKKTRHLTQILPFLKVIVNAQQQFPELVKMKLNLDDIPSHAQLQEVKRFTKYIQHYREFAGVGEHERERLKQLFYDTFSCMYYCNIYC